MASKIENNSQTSESDKATDPGPDGEKAVPRTKGKVLVTGIAGFIGSHLAEALIKKGYEVVGLLKPGENTRWIKNLPAKLIYGDITEKDSLYEAVSGVTHVYHLAAILSSPNPKMFYEINYKGTKNLVEVCLDSGINLKRFLFISSYKAMGPTSKEGIFNEEKPCHPIDDYGRSKLLAEQFLHSLNGQLPFTVVRFPLVYGPRNFTGGIYLIFKLLNKGIRVNFESEFSVGFVNDVVNGTILACESPLSIGKTYIIGENKIYTSNEVMSIIENALEKKRGRLTIPTSLLRLATFIIKWYAKITGTNPVTTSKGMDNPYWRYDMSKAETDLGFKAKIPLKEGARITAAWYKKEGII
jgi:nucleoside-diphosphate-sugar epimerase